MYKGNIYCKIQMVIFSRLLHVKVKLRVSTSFSQFSEGKNKVDAVLNFDLLYKDCFNSQNNSANVFYYSPYLL